MKNKQKLYKFSRKTIDGNKNWLAVKFKNLNTKEIKIVKDALNELISTFFKAEAEPDEN